MEQVSLENCKVGGKGKMKINDERISKARVVSGAESIYLYIFLLLSNPVFLAATP